MRATTKVAAILVITAGLASGCGGAANNQSTAPAGVAGQTIDAPREREPGEFRVPADEVEIVEEPDLRIPEATVAGEQQESSAEQPCGRFELRGPTFASNEAVLNEDGHAALNALIADLRATGCGVDATDAQCSVDQLEVALSGHTDDLPTSRSGGNLQLSIDRANAVANVMSQAGIHVRSTDGYAETRPVPAPTPDNRTLAQIRQDNRRTEIEFHCAD